MGREDKIIWNPYSNNYFENPYPHLEKCRTNNPIQEPIKNSYFFFNYSDIYSILKSNDFEVSSLSDYFREKENYIFKNNSTTCPFLSQATKLWPMYLNGDIHRVIRSLITKTFYSFPLDDLINSSIDIIIKKYENKRSFNLVNFCSDFIENIVKSIFNLENVESNKIIEFSNLLAKSQDLFIPKQIYGQINEEIFKFRKHFEDSIFNKTLIKHSKILNFNSDELYSILLISFMAAFETSKDNLSTSFIEILQNQSIIEEILNSNEAKLVQCIEETFRISSPLQFTVRVNKHELNINNYEIPANSKLYLCLASANRDEKKFPSPNEFISNRTKNQHLAFGAGAHQCLGSSIAKRELHLCLQTFTDFLQNYSIKKVIWSKQIFMRTAKEVHLIKK